MEDNQTKNTTGSNKKAFCLLGIFLLLGICGGGWWWYQSTKYVSTDDARISGTIVSVSAKIPGKVTEVLVKEGELVKAGQVVARIDGREVLAQKQQGQAALIAAQAHYEEVVAGSRPQEVGQARANADQAQATLANADKNYFRMQKLYNDGAISAAQLDNARTAYEVAQQAVVSAGEKLDLTVSGSREETVKAAAAQVKQAEAALEVVTVLEEYATVLAPANGTVVLKSINPGEVVAAGQPLFSVADLQDVWVNARIEETKIGQLRLGQTVEYTIDGYPSKIFLGKIYEIGSAASSVFALIPTENASGNFTKVTQRIPVKVSLPENSGVVFRPGMSVIVKIHLES